MNGFLEKANIVPGAQYEAIDFHNAIKSLLNINPSIHCVREKEHHGEQYLSEIKICFDKKLELVNCDGVLNGDATNYNEKIITNCEPNLKINYPSELPQYLINRADPDATKSIWHFPWVNFYKLIRMLQLFTF